MPRSKRPSMQGKGAELFFTGDLPEASSPDVPPGSEAGTGSEKESKLASLQERRKESNVPSLEGAFSEVEFVVWEAALARMGESGNIANTFRYAQAELDALDDLVHEVRRSFSQRIAKQDVARLALNLLITDFVERREGSFLAVYLSQQQRKPGR